MLQQLIHENSKIVGVHQMEYHPWKTLIHHAPL